MSPKCKCVLHHTARQEGGGKELFATTVDRAVYRSPLSSPDTNLQHTPGPRRYLEIIKHLCVCVLLLSPCAHCDRAPPMSAAMCVLVQMQNRPHNIAMEMGKNLNEHKIKEMPHTAAVNSQLILLYSLFACFTDALCSSGIGRMIIEVFITVLYLACPPLSILLMASSDHLSFNQYCLKGRIPHLRTLCSPL